MNLIYSHEQIVGIIQGIIYQLEKIPMEGYNKEINANYWETIGYLDNILNLLNDHKSDLEENKK